VFCIFYFNICHPDVFLNIYKVQIFSVKHVQFIVFECVFNEKLDVFEKICTLYAYSIACELWCIVYKHYY